MSEGRDLEAGRLERSRAWSRLKRKSNQLRKSRRQDEKSRSVPGPPPDPGKPPNPPFSSPKALCPLCFKLPNPAKSVTGFNRNPATINNHPNQPTLSPLQA